MNSTDYILKLAPLGSVWEITFEDSTATYTKVRDSRSGTFLKRVVNGNIQGRATMIMTANVTYLKKIANKVGS